MVVVDEKEKKIKESMKMVGLRDSVFWYVFLDQFYRISQCYYTCCSFIRLSWFVIYSVMVFFISLLGCILVYFVVLKSSNFGILLILMFEYGLSVIMLAFMMTALFSKAKVGGGRPKQHRTIQHLHHFSLLEPSEDCLLSCWLVFTTWKSS